MKPMTYPNGYVLYLSKSIWSKFYIVMYVCALILILTDIQGASCTY